MAVANPSGNLTPAFGLVQSALARQAQIQSQNRGKTGLAAQATGAVKDIATERRANAENERLLRLKFELQEEAAVAAREFEDRFTVGIETEDDLDEAAEAFDIAEAQTFGLPLFD